MRGGNGNDIYYVDDREDVVLEAPGQGVDTVYSTVTRTLGPHIEHLLLQGTADINGGGNDLANQITGNSGANFISGKEGADTLLGMAGNDRLDGGTGIDVMRGGAGDDIYYIGEAGDRTVEKANEGTDTVFSSLTRRLGSHLENLRLLGTDNLNGAGNALDNGLYGNEGANVLRGEGGVDWLEGGGGNDTLDGGVGGDAMRGGTGDDLYKVDDLGDRTVETTAGPEGGIDTVESSVDRSLGDNIENLRLVGSAGISGYGNELANAITGNGGANVLSGREGNDTLTGGGGNDTLSGGEGDDLLIGGRGDDNLNGGAGADTFRFSGAGDGTDTINAFVAAEDRFDLSGSRFTSATQTGTDTRLKHAGGTIIVTGVRGLTLEDWNALVAPSASLAFTAADGASALADPQHDGWTFTPSSPADLFVVMPVDGPLVGHADFV
jgi:Ca2+-binding RTX toxin-like protein